MIKIVKDLKGEILKIRKDCLDSHCNCHHCDYAYNSSYYDEDCDTFVPTVYCILDAYENKDTWDKCVSAKGRKLAEDMYKICRDENNEDCYYCPLAERDIDCHDFQCLCEEPY